MRSELQLQQGTLAIADGHSDDEPPNHEQLLESDLCYRLNVSQDDLQEVASFRPCQRPCEFNLMHPSMSFEAQTHRPMPCGCDTYTNRPNLSRDDWSESNRDASLDGDPDSDRHSKEETPCPNSSGTSAKDMDACTFSLASHWIQAVATSSLATLILSSFDTNPVSRHGPLDRPSPQHAVDFGIGPLSPSSLSSHRSTRLVRPFCSPPPTRTSRLAAAAQQTTHSGTPVHSHSGPPITTRPTHLYSFLGPAVAPPPLLTWTTPRLGQQLHRPSLECHGFTNAHIAIHWTKGGVDKARTSPCVGGDPFINKRHITRPFSSFEPQCDM